ncbi:GNAT family N-acetyltransferase [Pseudoflavitalea sp. G-6-1-2]|uniref:GNAT family N-acetyltransferase n=1 Tax=Pseudoflavitalea sp. G-6-1-2 TaxID=2728841 RepID=UPI00146D99A6|nr:GNAT family N-acetyltransferase [Pseudoflavitalea sp. G-6-1-2]NML22623.1 GNAT family N-acetyltransferase [Pseudoflavitalea sp. G-6-1-2]
MNLQTILQNQQWLLLPVTMDDFDTLFQVASDPVVWAGHPNKEQYKESVFRNGFFQTAIESKGAYKIIDKATEECIGSSRFYEYDANSNSIVIGYTFFAVKYWGKGVNQSVKKIMLDYIFQFVDEVHFHVGATNIRSQIAIGRTGAVKIGEREKVNPGKPTTSYYVYAITSNQWQKITDETSLRDI